MATENCYYYHHTYFIDFLAVPSKSLNLGQTPSVSPTHGCNWEIWKSF